LILLGGKVAVGDLGGLGVGQPPSRGRDTSLLVLAVIVQMPCERLERVGAGAAGVEAVVVVVQTVVQDGDGAWLVMISFELVTT
jgi:hypothetical protein